jgi:DNA-binding SARP family transcriptional activator
VHFRILGPLEVSLDRPVLVSASKYRSVLAALLLGANRVQSVERLIDVVWDERPPATARNLISVYVHHIRKLLTEAGGAGGALIATKPPGYQLRVSDEQLDLLVFERLVRAGRAEASRSEHAAAGARFREALALWRGPALSDVSSALLSDVDVPRLEETRLTVLEERVETDLALGRHAQLVAELEALSVEHPFRERLCRQLLLALYRSGRRGEAVRRYQRIRQVLMAELGVEPGPGLQQLAQAILAGDESLEVGTAGVVAPAGRPAPVQTPAGVPDFVGRERELAWLDDHLRAADDGTFDTPLLVLTGMPGTGKSVLAAHAAHRFADRFPDGQLYADLRGSGDDPADSADVLAGLLAALGWNQSAIPADLGGRARMFRAQIADRRMLVVLDDAHQEAQVRPLLPAAPHGAVLVTSRDPLTGLEGARFRRIGVLDADDALALLRRIVGRRRVAAEELAARDLLRLCGYLPLAVRIAGARLAARQHWPLGLLAHRLEHAEPRLAELHAGDLDVRSSLMGGYHRLPAEERRAFRLLGLLPELPVPDWAIAALADRGPAAVENSLDALIQAHLVTVAGRDEAGQLRYQQQPLLRDLARTLQAEEPGVADAALIRLLTAYLSMAGDAQSALARDRPRWRAEPPAQRATGSMPWPEPPGDPVAWFRAEKGVLLWCVHRAFTTERWDLTWRLALVQTDFFEIGGHAADWEHIQARGLAAARRAADPAAQAALLDGLGRLHTSRARWPEAMTAFTDALALAIRAGDLARQAYTSQSIAELHAREGRDREEARHRNRAREIFAAIGRQVPPLDGTAARAA